MKFSLLIGISLLLMNFGFTTSEEFKSVGPEVIVKLQYNDGKVVTKVLSLEEVAENLDVFNEEGLFACTYQFPDGECTVTASTCDAAKAGFNACACNLGHEPLCAADE